MNSDKHISGMNGRQINKSCQNTEPDDQSSVVKHLLSMFKALGEEWKILNLKSTGGNVGLRSTLTTCVCSNAGLRSTLTTHVFSNADLRSTLTTHVKQALGGTYPHENPERPWKRAITDQPCCSLLLQLKFLPPFNGRFLNQNVFLLYLFLYVVSQLDS